MPVYLSELLCYIQSNMHCKLLHMKFVKKPPIVCYLMSKILYSINFSSTDQILIHCELVLHNFNVHIFCLYTYISFFMANKSCTILQLYNFLHKCVLCSVTMWCLENSLFGIRLIISNVINHVLRNSWNQLQS